MSLEDYLEIKILTDNIIPAIFAIVMLVIIFGSSIIRKLVSKRNKRMMNMYKYEEDKEWTE